MSALERLRAAIERLTGARSANGRDPLGPRGEREAARCLERKGYRVLDRNVRVPVGEADLLCLTPDGRTLVVVEVKARRLAAGETPGQRAARRPEDAITRRKQLKLARVTESVAHRRGWSARPVRIDVVAVEFPAKGRPQTRHYENAVRT
jgi:putative endonuclease